MTITERYNEWVRRANENAKELNLSIEFTTEELSRGWDSERSACVEIESAAEDEGEVVPNDPRRYFSVSGSTTFE